MVAAAHNLTPLLNSGSRSLGTEETGGDEEITDEDAAPSYGTC